MKPLLTERVRSVEVTGAIVSPLIELMRFACTVRYVMSLILLIVLIVILLGAWPAWPYSRSWGYYPAGGVGVVLVIVIVLLLLGVI